MGGKPCIRGMNVTVSTIVGLILSGNSFEEILRVYRYLEEENLRESLCYGVWRVKDSEYFGIFNLEKQEPKNLKFFGSSGVEIVCRRVIFE